MTVTLWSAPAIFMTKVYEDIVVLDLKADRYECLVEAAAWLCVRDDGRLTLLDEGMARQLIETGLATDRPPPGRPVLTPPGRALDDSLAVCRPEILRAGLVMLTAALAFRSRSLQDLTASPPPVPSPRRFDEDRLTEVVCAARAAAPHIPLEGECLQRAYRLRRLLWREGFRPQWVFGVRTWPFGAHCWLQIGDLVVGDTLDRVRFYTPIMAA